MRISDITVSKIMTSLGVEQAKINALLEQEHTEHRPLQDLVISANIISTIELTKKYAEIIDVPFVELNAKDVDQTIVKSLPERVAKQYKVILFNKDPSGVNSIAMADPDDIQAINFLRKSLGQIKIYIAPEEQINAMLDIYRDNIEGELTKVISTNVAAINDTDDEIENITENDLAEDSPIAQTVNLIIEYGVNSSASDIHIEPRDKFVIIRYRIDGILQEANKLPRKLLNALVSRIKILANLKIDEHRAPQDGRFKIQVGSQVFALRVSILPVVDGEKVVMRILNESSKAQSFKELGFWGDALIDLEQAIIEPYGLILVTGPTGSGKSTTLFSVLSLLNTPEVNISTIEDPVEYRIQGVNQTQVNPVAGMSFGSGLRALLRQDPNIIMVGEVRDVETADLAVQAALTGHLVFTTLHTNNVSSTLPRLLDMGVETFLIASTVKIVIGQRLVRRLCAYCKIEYQPDAREIAELKKTFSLDKNGGLKKISELEDLAIKDHIGEDNDQVPKKSCTETTIKYLYKASPNGCNKCNNNGFRGRIGIYEVLKNDESIQHLIIAHKSAEDINIKAKENGMINMQLDGLVKALRAETTIEEILRVTTKD